MQVNIVFLQCILIMWSFIKKESPKFVGTLRGCIPILFWLVFLGRFDYLPYIQLLNIKKIKLKVYLKDFNFKFLLIKSYRLKSLINLNAMYFLYPKLLECFKKSLCPKSSDSFSKWSSEEFFWKFKHRDGKKHYQLA
jgi:predicted neutral ceramidase superfamily lipid hydrolase